MFNPLGATVVSRIVAGGLLSGSPSIIDMGNQTFGVDAPSMERIREMIRCSSPLPGANPEALHRIETGGDVTVERFYKALGFGRYDAIDVNDRYGSLIMDLNCDLEVEYGFTRRYDLVVNLGTSEHVFDQRTFFKNVHALAKPGGLMLHFVPFTGYLNHGFYCYQPNLFEDLAAANGYELIEIQLGDRNGVMLDIRRPGELYPGFLPFLGLTTPNHRNNTLLVILMRKVKDAEFVHPFQGRYLRQVDDRVLEESRSGQSVLAEETTGKGPRHGSDGYTARLRRRLRRKLLLVLRRVSRLVLLRI